MNTKLHAVAEPKEAAPLFAATHFKDDRRSKANATVCGLVVLDIDHGGSIDECRQIMQDLEIAGLFYTTASHRLDHHKFRVCVPLTVPVDYQTHVHAWHAVNAIFTDQTADPSKIGCESLFFLPGTYPGAPTEFYHQDGLVLSAEEWIDFSGIDVQTLVPAATASIRPICVVQQRSGKHRPFHTSCTSVFGSEPIHRVATLLQPGRYL